VESNQLLKNNIVSGKIIHMSKKIHTFSEILDDFLDTNIIIKRPDEGAING
jgi:hypothetical protein